MISVKKKKAEKNLKEFESEKIILKTKKRRKKSKIEKSKFENRSIQKEAEIGLKEDLKNNKFNNLRVKRTLINDKQKLNDFKQHRLNLRNKCKIKQKQKQKILNKKHNFYSRNTSISKPSSNNNSLSIQKKYIFRKNSNENQIKKNKQQFLKTKDFIKKVTTLNNESTKEHSNIYKKLVFKKKSVSKSNKKQIFSKIKLVERKDETKNSPIQVKRIHEFEKTQKQNLVSLSKQDNIIDSKNNSFVNIYSQNERKTKSTMNNINPTEILNLQNNKFIKKNKQKVYKCEDISGSDSRKNPLSSHSNRMIKPKYIFENINEKIGPIHINEFTPKKITHSESKIVYQKLNSIQMNLINLEQKSMYSLKNLINDIIILRKSNSNNLNKETQSQLNNLQNIFSICYLIKFTKKISMSKTNLAISFTQIKSFKKNAQIVKMNKSFHQEKSLNLSRSK